MKNEGKRFEEDFKKSVPEKYFIYRFKDGTANFKGTKNENVRFQAHNICDFQVVTENKVFLLELKSYNGVSIPLSGIRKTQLEEMLKASNYKNIEPYFMFNFRPLQKVYAVKVENVQAFIEKAERKSIPVRWCIENGIEIDGIKKKVRFKYNLESFFRNIYS
ncbi:Holliday junction resolvase RecU [Clostridium sardiniense]|uniref:Holliday junction resolvase RecU n=1 Tax=Clostridium sardiniense TaxID=29369 RepID=A0ABS7L0D2_CLOSR|nr:Holliday junction resolvase RecU [Clostridium sardiniense]MBY0756530.1 Holliday junction resolvase RecU [Clostridium sardiniense]MDQ0460278.1 recombination protein U [Clostridium sardiniense]